MDAADSDRVRVGAFELDRDAGELYAGHQRIRLQEQPFQILLMLLERPKGLIRREEIQKKLWPDDRVVEFEHSIHTAINKLRIAFGDSAQNPRYIETVARRGYRLIATVERPDTVEGLLDNSTDPEELSHKKTSAVTTPPEDSGSVRAQRNMGERAGRLRPWFIAIILVCTVALCSWLVRSVAAHGLLATFRIGHSPPATAHTIPLTSLPGLVRDPAFSPDAKQIAFLWNGENPTKSDLYVQTIGSDKPLRLTHTSSGLVRSPTWSPDGREIAFARCDDHGGAIFVVPAKGGGNERKLTEVACITGDVQFSNWSSDGKFLVLADRCFPNGPRAIVVFSVQTGDRRCLTTPPSGDIGDLAPALSPDQGSIAFIRMPTHQVCDIYTVSVTGGNLRRLTSENKFIPKIMWAADGRSIIFKSTRSGLGRPWRVSVDTGAIEADNIYPEVGALSRDGGRLAYTQGSGSASIWRADLLRGGGPVVSQTRVIATSGTNDAAQLSPDGRHIVFESVRTGSREIWRSNADGTDPKQLTFYGGHAGTPRWSPDGKRIAFDYRPDTHAQVFVIDSEGRNVHAITSGDYQNGVASWSRDGASLYFMSNRTGDWQVWKRVLADGRETQITYHGGMAAFESFDGKTVYYSKLEGAGIWSVPATGGEERRITEAPHIGYWGHFAVVETGIYLVDADAANGPTILYYGFKTGQIMPVLVLKGDPFPLTANLAASPDGRTLLYVQAESKSVILMAENLQ